MAELLGRSVKRLAHIRWPRSGAYIDCGDDNCFDDAGCGDHAISARSFFGAPANEPGSISRLTIFVTALPAQTFLVSLTATILPAAIFVVCMHHIARALHRQNGFDYAVLGGLLAALCDLIFVPFTRFPMTSHLLPLSTAVVCGAIMGALYRRFAGLEPVPRCPNL